MYRLQTWLNNRESGLYPQGEQNSLMNSVYKTLAPFNFTNDEDEEIVSPNKSSEVGAVFNLEFSPEGNVVVGACEKKALLLYDAITTKEIHRLTDAHADYVNCVKFLDSRVFATCSDDTTVAIWDLRMLKTKVRSLHGHSNWVKNIEYCRKNNLLVTSGFDGSIFTWDINSHTEQGLIYQKVFHTSGLMRCRITPDGEKMIICTTGGYIMIIHRLDLTSLHKDLCGFRPGIYRLMQLGQQYIPQAAKFDHIFSKQQKKNRVELVTDFPEDNDAEVILALEIHPHGHSFLSRNISHDELSEWSCVHSLGGDDLEDVKEKPRRKRKLNKESDDDSNDERDASNRDAIVFTINRRVFDRANYSRQVLPPSPPQFSLPPPPPPPAPQAQPSTRSTASQSSSGSSGGSGGGSSSSSSTSASTTNPRRTYAGNHRVENFVPDIWAAEVTLQERASRQNRTRGSNSTTGYNFVYAISSGVLPALNLTTTRSQGTMTTPSGGNNNNNNNNNTSARQTPSSASASGSSNGANNQSQSSSENPDSDSSSAPASQSSESARTRSLKIMKSSRQILQNPKKLLYFIQESNSGRGFIKEPCFSRDGRIISSPYDNGVRLLGFTENCSEFPFRLRSSANPKELVEIQNLSAHSDIVFCTKFSPRESLLVTGCRSGKVIWYYPKF